MAPPPLPPARRHCPPRSAVGLSGRWAGTSPLKPRSRALGQANPGPWHPICGPARERGTPSFRIDLRAQEADMFDKIKNAASNLGDLGELGDLKDYADNITFPASKEQIIDQLQRSGVKEDVIAKVREVGQEYFQDKGDLLKSFMDKR
jgi:hypothetical protein